MLEIQTKAVLVSVVYQPGYLNIKLQSAKILLLPSKCKIILGTL